MNTTKPPMTKQEIEQWIDACNHEPAREVLRDYLKLAALSPPAVEGLPPSCGPAETLSNETLVNVALQTAGRAAMYENEIQHNRLMECRAELLQRLALTPAGNGGAVDDAMVERFCEAFFRPQWHSINDHNHNLLRDSVRAALTAALAAPQDGEAEDDERAPDCIECGAAWNEANAEDCSSNAANIKRADQPVGDDWQPIESIPRNGDRVQLLAANGKTDAGNWYAFADWIEPSDDVQDRLSTDNGEGDYTHWRPLAAAAGDAGGADHG